MTIETKGAAKMYKVFAYEPDNDDVQYSKTKLNIIVGKNRIDVDMNIDRKTLKGAHRVFLKALAQAVEDGVLDAKVAEWGYFADDINDTDFGGKDYVTFHDDINNSFGYGVEDNSACGCGIYFWFWTNIEVVSTDANEANVEEYAVTIEAQEEATDAEIELANSDYQPQTEWENPHDFTIVGDLSDRNLNGRIIAQNIAREQEQELKELKADGDLYLLKVITPTMHPYRNFNFEIVINSYKSLDALKKFGRNKIHDCDWRIETIDGKLIAKGNGVDDFNNFCNDKEEDNMTDNMILAKQITDKLGSLLVKFSHANEGNDGGLALHYETFKDEHDEFGTLTSIIEVFTDESSYILDHVNFITGYGDDKKVEKFFFKHDDFNAKLAKLQAKVKAAWNNLADKQPEQDLVADSKLHAALREEYKLGDDKAKELRNQLLDATITNAHDLIITDQFGKQIISNLKSITIDFDIDVGDTNLGDGFFIALNQAFCQRKLAFYSKPEQVTAVFKQLSDAISRGATEFKFPTSDELNQPSDKHINDSLIRAMETCLLNIQAVCLTKPTNLTAINREWELYNICNNALLRKEVA